MDSWNDLIRPLESQLYSDIEAEDWESVEELLVEINSQKVPVVRRTAGNTLLHFATEKEIVPLSVIDGLVEVLDPSCLKPNKWGLTPLHNVVMSRNSVEVVSLLLQLLPAAIDLPDRSGYTPIDYFLTRGLPEDDEDVDDERFSPETMRILARAWTSIRGDDVTNGKAQTTPLHMALNASLKHPNLPTCVVEVLLEENRSWALAADENGCTPLHLASRQDDDNAVDRVRLLLNASPSSVLQLKDENGRTPLSSAVFWFASLPVHKLLVATCPSCIHAPDRNGKTPLDLLSDMVQGLRAISGYTHDVAKALVMGNNHDPCGVLHRSMRLEYCPVDLVRMFLRRDGHAALCEDDKGNLPLHNAAYMSTKPNDKMAYRALIRELLKEHPPAVRIPSHDGILPLGHFIRAGRSWNEGVRIVFEAHPAAVVDQGLDAHALTKLLSKLGKWKRTPAVLHDLIREAPFLVSRQSN